VETVETTYSGRLKQAREHAKLSQAELGRRIGKSAQAIQYLEDPRQAAQGSKMTPRIAQECGVSSVWLASGAGAMLAQLEAPAQRPILAGKALARSIDALAPDLRQAISVLIENLSMHSRRISLGANESEPVSRSRSHRRLRAA
jgi:transcriptional regulator with XRE-family HTH domain